MRDFLRRPLSTTELRAVLDRLFSRQAGAAAPAAQGRVAAFVSNKGGVGKSTLSVNVACGLALRHPDEVLLIDTSLQVGTCAMLLDLKPTTSIVDAIRERDRLDETLLRHLTLRHGSGLRLLAAPVDALEGAEVDDEAISRIAEHGAPLVQVRDRRHVSDARQRADDDPRRAPTWRSSSCRDWRPRWRALRGCCRCSTASACRRRGSASC